MIDYDNFFISGDSADGHIASLIAKEQTNDFSPTIIISANNDFIKMQVDKFCKNAKDFDISVNHYIFAVDKFTGHDFTINYPHTKEGVYAICKIDEFINNLKQNKIQNGVFKFKQKIKR